MESPGARAEGTIVWIAHASMGPPAPRPPWLDQIAPSAGPGGCVSWRGLLRRLRNNSDGALSRVLPVLTKDSRRVCARPEIARFHKLAGTDAPVFDVRMSCDNMYCVAPHHMRVVTRLRRAAPVHHTVHAPPCRGVKRAHDARSSTVSVSVASEDGDYEDDEEPLCKRARLEPASLTWSRTCDAVPRLDDTQFTSVV
jgi:hypothetical protein